MLRISKTGVAVADDMVALDEVNEKAGPDEEPKPNEETFDGVDLRPNENPVDGEEPNREPEVEDDEPRELLPNRPEVAAGVKVLPPGLEELALAEKEKPEFILLEPVEKENPELEFDALATEEKKAELVLDTPVPDEKENPELELVEEAELKAKPEVEPNGFALWFVVPKGTCPNPGEDELFDPNAEDDVVPKTDMEELLNPNVADEAKEPD